MDILYKTGTVLQVLAYFYQHIRRLTACYCRRSQSDSKCVERRGRLTFNRYPCYLYNQLNRGLALHGTTCKLII
jgi:hypothetical protein